MAKKAMIEEDEEVSEDDELSWESDEDEDWETSPQEEN